MSRLMAILAVWMLVPLVQAAPREAVVA